MTQAGRERRALRAYRARRARRGGRSVDSSSTGSARRRGCAGGAAASARFSGSCSVSSRGAADRGGALEGDLGSRAARARCRNSRSAQAPERSSDSSRCASMRTRAHPGSRSTAAQLRSRALELARAPRAGQRRAADPAAAAANLDGHAAGCSRPSALGVQMRLEEPEVLVGLARDAGEQVGGIGIPERSAVSIAARGFAA